VEVGKSAKPCRLFLPMVKKEERLTVRMTVG
jgi:hypothetical protein